MAAKKTTPKPESISAKKAAPKLPTAKATPKAKGIAPKEATSNVTTTSKKKVAAKTGIPSRDGGFAAKLALWEALIDEAVAAPTAAAVQKAYRKAEALDHLPIDLYNEDDADEAALGRAHTAMNEKLSARMKALPLMSDVAREVGSLRDLINVT